MTTHEFAGKKILVVEDDDSWSVDLIPRMLEGATLCLCKNPADAIRKLDSDRPDAVVVDLFLAHGTSGSAVVRAAKRRGIPVIVYTGSPALAPKHAEVVDKALPFGRLADVLCNILSEPLVS